MSRLLKPQFENETFEYEVKEGDTLISIASKFDIRVSILKQINRLLNDFIFPNKILYIPLDKNKQVSGNSKSSEETISDSISPDIDKLKIDYGAIVNHEDYIIDFKKTIYSIKDAKYITEDEGVVFGTLLLSTSGVMFEASSLEPLVIEFGHDRFSLIIPNEFIVRFQIVDNPHASNKQSSKIPITYRKPINDLKLNDPDSVFLEDVSLPNSMSNKNVDEFSSKGSTPIDNVLLNKSSSFLARENRMSPLYVGTPGSSKLFLFSKRLGSITEFGKFNEISFSNSPANCVFGNVMEDSSILEDADNSEGNKSCPATPIDIPRSDLTNLKSDSNKTDSIGSSTSFAFPMSGASFVYPDGYQIYLDLNNEIFSHDPNDRGRQTKDLRDLPPLLPDGEGELTVGSPFVKFNVDHLSDDEDESNRTRHNSAKSQPIEFAQATDLLNIRVSGMRGNFQSFLGPSNMPALFKDYNKMALNTHEVTNALPWYLIIECGVPLLPIKNPPRAQTGEYKNYLKPIFIFAVQYNKIDDLYNYLINYFPQQYGDEKEVTRSARAFADLTDYKSLIDINLIVRKDSSNINISEAACSQSDFLDLSHVLMPTLSQPSNILSDLQIKMLAEHLPSQHCVDVWSLAFTSDIHGTSLLSMYRSAQSYDSSCLIVIKDNHSQIFGALLSHSLKISRGFYGDGKTFLFSFRNKFKVFKWTEHNSNLILATKDSLCIGATEGHFGLYIDGDLNHGRTQKCLTFNNLPLSETEDFFIRQIELWCFTNK